MEAQFDLYHWLKNRSAIGEEFRVRRLIGTGASSVVVQATQRALTRTVALKILADADDIDQLLRFRQEAALLSGVDHRNVVKLLDVGMVHRHPYLVLEYLDGGSLESSLKMLGRYPWQIAVRILSQVLAGLQACHSAGIVHRDVKPANILFTRSGVAKLADLGLSRSSGRTRLTAHPSRIGTPLYMSPEVAGGQEAGPAADVYSAAVVLYEMISGHPPFRADCGLAVMQQHMETRPAPIGECVVGVPAFLEEVLGIALAKDPLSRYANAGQFLAALKGLPSGQRARPEAGILHGAARSRSFELLRAILLGATLGTLLAWMI